MNGVSGIRKSGLHMHKNMLYCITMANPFLTCVAIKKQGKAVVDGLVAQVLAGPVFSE